MQWSLPSISLFLTPVFSNLNLLAQPCPSSHLFYIFCRYLQFALSKSSHCLLWCCTKIERQERGTGYWEYRWGILCALICVQNQTRERSGGMQNPNLQIVRKSRSARADTYSLQGWSFRFAQITNLTNAEQIFAGLVSSISLAEMSHRSTSHLFAKQSYSHKFVACLFVLGQGGEWVFCLFVCLFYCEQKIFHFYLNFRKDSIILAEPFTASRNVARDRHLPWEITTQITRIWQVTPNWNEWACNSTSGNM